MLITILKAIRCASRRLDGLLAVRLPMDIVSGLQTAERRFWRGSNLWMTRRR
jgi:hypothetical protein